MARRRFECEEDGSRKFWEIDVEGSNLTIRFGRIGTDGQTKTKSLDSSDAADREASKLVTEKTRKGYREITDGAAAEPAQPSASKDATAATPVAEKSAPAPKAKKPAKGAAWKPVTVNGRYLAAAPDGSFIVVDSLPVNVDGAFKASLTIYERSGTTKQITTPGSVRGLAVMADGRIVASIGEDYPIRTPRTYEHAGVAIYDSTGTLLRAIASPDYAGAGAIAVDRARGRVAFRAVPGDMGHPRYLDARLVVLDPNTADGSPVVVDFEKFSPVFAFDEAGALWAYGGRRGVRIDRDGSVHEVATPDGGFSVPLIRGDHLGMAVAGRRIASVALLDTTFVTDDGAVKFTIPENIVERAFLLDGGRTLLTAASATKARLGPGALEAARWPDPEPALRETNLAAWDIETGRLKKAVAVGAANLMSVAIVENEWIAVLTAGRSSKVEFVPWSALAGG